jgi:hypothetical protein
VRLVLGEIAAQGVVLAQVLAFADACRDFVFYGEEVLVPVGLHLVDVDPRVEAKRQLDGTDLTFETLQVVQAGLDRKSVV